MQNTEESTRIAHNRVIWQSRRGMLELDIVLEPFARDSYVELDSGAQADYRRLLASEDQQLYDWLLKKRAVDDATLAGIIDIILQHHSERAAKA